MKKPNVSNMFYSLFLVAVIILYGCATVNKEWQGAFSLDNIAAYEQFLTKHPKSDQAEKAKIGLEELRIQSAWDNARRKNSIITYKEFLKNYPNYSQYSTLAKSVLEELMEELIVKEDWERARSLGTESGYRDFLSNHPYSSTALEQLAQFDLQKFTNSKNTTFKKITEDIYNQNFEAPDHVAFKNIHEWVMTILKNSEIIPGCTAFVNVKGDRFIARVQHDLPMRTASVEPGTYFLKISPPKALPGGMIRIICV